MGNRKTIWFIINPISGTRHGADIGLIVRNTLDSNRFDVTIRYTERRGHGADIAREAVESGVNIVAAVGGDGTINEVAAQLVASETVLAIVPHGSGNGLAYHLHIPMNLKKSLDVINDFRVEKLDVGYVNDRPFFSIAGIGFDAKVAYDFEEDPHRGFITYFKHILNNYFQYQSAGYHIEYDGKVLDEQAFFITFANSSQWGYNVKIAPMASIHDGKLDVCIVKRPQHLLKMLNVDVPKLLGNHFEKSDIVQYLQCERLKIVPHVLQPMFLHVDGDTAGMVEEVEIRVVRGALKVIVPLNLR